MARRVQFQPAEYRELSQADQDLLATGYERAREALRQNVTPLGFSACSLKHNEVYGTDVNYRRVWARDGAITAIWTLEIDDEEIRTAQAATFRSLLDNQSPTGQIPTNVSVADGVPDYAGLGGIASIDSALWVIIGIARYAAATGDWGLVNEYRTQLQRSMDWLSAHDSNNCGLLEIPEASDWADLFGFSYHVLYDEVLWFRTLRCYADILEHLGEHDRAVDYSRWCEHVRNRCLREFWPTTARDPDDDSPLSQFTDTQYSLGDTRYLVAQTAPFSFSWRCDVCGNLLAYLTDMVDRERAVMTFRFLWGVGVNEPWPVKNLYPPVQAGDPEWRDYYTVNLLNLPNHYHNGGIWPFVGGMWCRFIHKLGFTEIARRELVKLAQLCRIGLTQEWEFNEWHHGITGRPMGKAYQAWSAASFLKACQDLNDEGDLIHLG